VTREAYENVEEQIGGCGIWCGSCAVGNGALRELGRRFKEVLDAHGAAHWAPPEMDYPTFDRGLETLALAASCPGCRKGGGRDDCVLRSCSAARNLADCSECPSFASCEHDRLLQIMRSGARKAELRVRDPGEDADDVLATWIAELPTTWPSLCLFLEDA
jgi:hypothetical protein